MSIQNQPDEEEDAALPIMSALVGHGLTWSDIAQINAHCDAFFERRGLPASYSMREQIHLACKTGHAEKTARSRTAQ
ncbi:MAG: hypothetical protein H0X34_17870 [Chthoniobacterales bacterium]|nr:hypothetical protein [Chthoniobacterales bacterium]